MKNKDFAVQLEQRTLKFAIIIIKLSSQLTISLESKIIRNQLTKSGTSIGANYREANRARSKADFSNKIKICEGEASELIYWIEIITELDWIDKDRLKPIITEAKELLAIFSSIGKNLRT